MRLWWRVRHARWGRDERGGDESEEVSEGRVEGGVDGEQYIYSLNGRAAHTQGSMGGLDGEEAGGADIEWQIWVTKH
jgi:hypothetical protein